MKKYSVRSLLEKYTQGAAVQRSEDETVFAFPDGSFLLVALDERSRFFAAHTGLDLDALLASMDTREDGSYLSDLRTANSDPPGTKAIEFVLFTRSNGVLCTQLFVVVGQPVSTAVTIMPAIYVELQNPDEAHADKDEARHG